LLKIPWLLNLSQGPRPKTQILTKHWLQSSISSATPSEHSKKAGISARSLFAGCCLSEFRIPVEKLSDVSAPFRSTRPHRVSLRSPAVSDQQRLRHALRFSPGPVSWDDGRLTCQLFPSLESYTLKPLTLNNVFVYSCRAELRLR